MFRTFIATITRACVVAGAVTVVLTASISPAAAQSKTTAAAQKSAAMPKPVWPDEGVFKWAPRPTVAAITANDLRTRLYQFADDSMLGRRVGELGNYKGTEYIGREFKRLGLKPAGENGTYFQELPFGPTGYDSATTRLIAGNIALAGHGDWVPIAPTAANSLGAKADINNVQTVFAGRWRDTTRLDPAMFKGKIAVFISTASAAGLIPAGRGGGRILSCDSVPDKFGAAAAAKVEAAVRADSAAGRGGRGGGGGGGRGAGRGGPPGSAADSRVGAAGAVGILIITDSVPRAAVASAFNGRGGMKPATTAAPADGPPAAAVSYAAAAKLFGKPVDQLTVGATGEPVTESWSYEWRKSKWPARNVIAIMPGSNPSLAAEYVLVSAHNDHNGVNPTSVDHDSLRAVNFVTRRQGSNDPVCRPTAAQQHEIDSIITRARSIRPPRRDSTNNGADDDGSGTVILLEIAERFASEKPARSIIFVSHVGEEAGLLGSKWFTDHPTVPLANIVAAHNMDMEAKGRTDEVKFGGPSSLQTLGSRHLSREFGDIIDSVNAIRTSAMAIDKTWDVVANPLNKFCRSDQVNYVKHDVPVTYFSTGFSLDYHQVTDEPQYADYDHMARIGNFIHDVVMAIATRKDRPAITGPDMPYAVCR